MQWVTREDTKVDRIACPWLIRRTACTLELGLEVPGRHQEGNPRDGAYRAAGLDLTPEQCQDLVAFIRSLPAPAEHASATARDAEVILSGRATFERVGRAACHAPKLGEVERIYRDLLLHDLGEIGAHGPALPEPAAVAPTSEGRSTGGEPGSVAEHRGA
jgi:hypothetical protein